jgi:hypothetical protein
VFGSTLEALQPGMLRSIRRSWRLRSFVTVAPLTRQSYNAGATPA